MAAILTANEFSKHVNTNFRATFGAETKADLELVEVKVYTSRHEEQSGMERFSVYFTGPADPHLPQKLYAIQHERWGNLKYSSCRSRAMRKGRTMKRCLIISKKVMSDE